MMSAPLIPLPDRAIIAIGGPDRVAFLQGLISNDVTRAGQDRAIWAALLTAQGKYLHDFILFADNDRLLLDVEASRREDLLRRLRMYKLRSKVELTDLSDEYRVLADPGPADAPAGQVIPVAGGWSLVDPRHAGLGRRLVLRADATPAATGAFATWDRARLLLGIPDGTRDLVVEKSILLDNGFDELHAIAWDKGCYVGQELTARTKYRGLVKKRLLPVAVDGPLPEPGTPVTADGTEVGEIRSGCGDRALALIRLEALTMGRALACGGVRLRPQPPAWLPLPPSEGDTPRNE
ncbi:YgfZ/GcvT domain-containing protein [Niveispirillum fermenti]|uniref:CAF17-like 4Fe-4S cluster assembly/insertion protein YgfZ n=1 Tax=Niveispirillum fermenti TaxID=1233113 RepID=UPI003A8C66BE